MEDVIMAEVDHTDICEADTTVPEYGPHKIDRIEIQKYHYLENYRSCEAMLEASRRKRAQVREELAEVNRQKEDLTPKVISAFKTMASAFDLAAQSIDRIHENIEKRFALLKEIEQEKLWRPPSLEMCQKEQTELRERVEHMRAIVRHNLLHPDDNDFCAP